MTNSRILMRAVRAHPLKLQRITVLPLRLVEGTETTLLNDGLNFRLGMLVTLLRRHSRILRLWAANHFVFFERGRLKLHVLRRHLVLVPTHRRLQVHIHLLFQLRRNQRILLQLFGPSLVHLHHWGQLAQNRGFVGHGTCAGGLLKGHLYFGDHLSFGKAFSFLAIGGTFPARARLRDAVNSNCLLLRIHLRHDRLGLLASLHMRLPSTPEAKFIHCGPRHRLLLSLLGLHVYGIVGENIFSLTVQLENAFVDLVLAELESKGGTILKEFFFKLGVEHGDFMVLQVCTNFYDIR